MDRDKLNMAAEEYAAFETEDYGDIDERTTAHDNCIYGFRSGAEWLMGQSMADRLTEEEKMKIKNLNAIIESMFDMLPEGHVNCRRVIKAENMLIDIFGKEMFEK